MAIERAFENRQAEAARRTTGIRPMVDSVAERAQIALAVQRGPIGFYNFATRVSDIDPELKADAEKIMAENRALAEATAEREVFNSSYHGRTYGTFGVQNRELIRNNQGWAKTRESTLQLSLELGE